MPVALITVKFILTLVRVSANFEHSHKKHLSQIVTGFTKTPSTALSTDFVET